MAREESEFSTLLKLHLFFGLVAIFLYIGMSSYSWELKYVCIGLVVFEFIMTLNYGFGNLLLQVVHFQYQAILFSVPCFVLYIVVFNEFASPQAIAFLDSFHFVRIKYFVETRPVFWATLLFSFWTIRMILSHITVVDINTKERLESYGNLSLGEIRQSSIHKTLNLAAVVLFAIMAYFNEQMMQHLLFKIALIELIMTVSYGLKSSWIMLLHFVYQSMIFLVLIFVNYATILHRTYPTITSEFLSSYGLLKVENFAQNGSILAISILSTAWFVRMMACYVFLVEVATDARINQQQMVKRQLRVAQIV